MTLGNIRLLALITSLAFWALLIELGRNLAGW
jgi:hypothetical protein